MALLIIPYTNPKRPGSLAHAIARSDDVAAVVKRLQQQGYLPGPPVAAEPCWPPKKAN
jgi:hypothetical protein